jgi:outer membrane protein assembly factor BamB
MRAAPAVLSALAFGAVVLGGASARGTVASSDWPRFDYNPGSTPTGITAASVKRLHRRIVQLDGTVDSAPIYLHAVRIRGAVHDAIFITTSYGKTEALDANTGKRLWRYTPDTYGSTAGTAQITTMTPEADPSRNAIYAGEPDGRIVKLSVATGKLLWSTSITRDPTHEKLAGSLNFSRGLVLAATDGYVGDAPPYQGHVVSLNATNGRIAGVWNSLCSNRHTLIRPSTCPESDSAIWGRSAPVVDPASGDILVATGNGFYDGKTYWGDSVVVLSPDAKTMLKHWTPTDQDYLNVHDLDLGATAPALLSGGYFVQGGKDGGLRLLSLSKLAGVNPTTGGELQTVAVPGPTDLFSEPFVWQGTWVVLATQYGTAAWRLSGGKLQQVWSNDNGGTSPIVAGGLLYVEGVGGIRVYSPASGKQIVELPGGDVHWQSPIVADGRVIAAEGNSNNHLGTGILDIYR